MYEHINLFQNHLLSTHLLLNAGITEMDEAEPAPEQCSVWQKRGEKTNNVKYLQCQRRGHQEKSVACLKERDSFSGEAFSEWLFFIIRSVGEGRIDCREREWFVEARRWEAFSPGVKGMYSFGSLKI